LKENAEIQERANRELEGKVKRRTAEIASKNDLLTQQNEEIEAQRNQLQIHRDMVLAQKNEIIDSITYAQRIQSAMLPPESYFSELLNENFILYRPRDIVSGDFYWIKQVNQSVILAVADCTGHGVPGALLSMLGMSFLDEIVQRREITQANQVLNELRSHIKHSLRQHGYEDESKDGIDIALLVWDMRTKKIQFSGARNPLYLVRDVKGQVELEVIKGDPMPVGYYPTKDKPFNNHSIQLEPGDTIYLYTDGYVDQKGGKNNKKFLSKTFRNLLVEINEQPMHVQKEILEKTLTDWMGDQAQVDDILVVGVRVLS
jgi:serine phosphatase RsbU (regulator of sigma subunit)